MIDMTKGSPAKLVIRFTIPLLLGNVLQQMYNVVDSIVVGNFVGPDALAAVGNSFIIMFLLFSLFAGVGAGATILISQFKGAGNKEKIQITVDTMYIFMFIGGSLIGIVGFIFTPFFLDLLNTPQGIISEMSTTYLRMVFLGTLSTFGYSMNNAMLQGLGDGKSSLLFLAIATIINIILDLVFVVVFGMGVFGVALATVVAQSFAFLFGIIYINKKTTIFKIAFGKMHFSAEILKKSLTIGLPTGLQNVLVSVGVMVLQRLVNRFGADFMAGYSAAAKIDSFVFMPIMSFSMAMTTYVGQNIGAKKMDRVKQGVRSTLIIALSMSIVLSTLAIVFGDILLRAFTQDADVIFVGEQYMRRIMPCFPLLTIIFVLNASVRGAGETVVPMLCTLVSFLGARVPSAYLYTHFFDEYTMFWCFGTGWLVGVCIVVPYYLSGRWKKKSVITESL